MTRFLAVLLGLLTVGTPSLRACPPYRSYYPSYASYREVVVVRETPVYVAAFTPVVTVGVAAAVPAPVAVAAPVAAAAVVPQTGAVAAADPCANLRAEVAELRAAFVRLQAGYQSSGAASTSPPTDPRAATAAAPAAGVTAAKCQKCHTGQKAEKGFQLFTAPGVPATLTAEQRLKALSAVKKNVDEKGHMPPKTEPQLSNEDLGQFLNEMVP